MAKSAIFSIRILADGKDARKDIDETGSRLDKISSHAEKASAAMAAASGAVVAFGVKSFEAASDLQQSIGAATSVFGDWAIDVEQKAEQAAEAVGLSQNQYLELASVLGAQLKSFGLSSSEAYDEMSNLVGIGADLAATFGGTTSEAVESLGSLLRGESDPIEKYGISINAAAIESEMAAQKMQGLTFATEGQAKVAAISALVQQQSAGALGAFGREADTAAGQMQRASATWENAKAQIGEALLPIVAQAAAKFSELARWAGENPEKFHAIAIAIIAATGAIAGFVGVVKTVQAATAAWQAVQAVLNVTLSANPIGIIITAVAALAAGIIYAYNHSDTFRNYVNNLVSDAKTGFQNMIQWVKDVGQWFTNTGGRVAEWWNSMVNRAVDFKNQGVETFRSIVEWLDSFIQRIKNAINWVRSLANNITSGIPGGSRFFSETFASVGHPDLLAVPAANALLTAVPPVSFTAALAPRQSGVIRRRPQLTAPAPVFNITFNGPIDSMASAREIKDLLDEYDRRRAW